MAPILSSHQGLKLQPFNSQDYREELCFSQADAVRYGIRNGEYGILQTPNVILDVPGINYAVRLIIGDTGETAPGILRVSQPFFEEIQFGLGQEWELYRVDKTQPIQKITLEPSVEQEHLREDIRRMRRDIFNGRCFLATPGQNVASLSLRMTDQAYLNIRDITPPINTIAAPTVFVIGDNRNTDVNLFIPHRKGGVDMVIVVDASNSMELSDFIDRQGHRSTRMDGANLALRTLLQVRLYSGSRVSKLALVAFGRKAHIIYPPDKEMMVEINSNQVDAILRETRGMARHVQHDGSEDGRNGSDVIEAMDVASHLLYQNALEENEKVIVLLSDGATWVKQEDTGQVEFKVGRDDPVMFSNSLFVQDQIRIHTVAISNEENLRKFEPERYREDMNRQKGHRVWIPNPEMLQEVAQRTQALFFSSPDAESLNKLFEELGQGTVFPIV